MSSPRHWIYFLEQREPLRRNPAKMLPPILRTALTTNELFGLEAIEQSCHARRLLDHAIRHLKRRQPFVTRAAQNAEHVELLQREAVRLDERRHLPAHEVGRVHQADDRFMGRRLERPALAELVLHGGRHGSYITCQ